MKKIEGGDGVRDRDKTLHIAVREGLTEKATFEKQTKGGNLANSAIRREQPRQKKTASTKA